MTELQQMTFCLVEDHICEAIDKIEAGTNKVVPDWVVDNIVSLICHTLEEK